MSITKEIRLELNHSGRGKVFIDGQEMKGVHSIKFESTASEPKATKLWLGIYSENLVVVGPADTAFDVTTLASSAREYLSASDLSAIIEESNRRLKAEILDALDRRRPWRSAFAFEFQRRE